MDIVIIKGRNQAHVSIFFGVKGSFNFDKPLIERIACSDEIDQEILQLLYESGSPGVLFCSFYLSLF
jgi:hypothetical protein